MQNVKPRLFWIVPLGVACVLLAGEARAAWDPNSNASNTDSIVNTRHNLTQSYIANTSDRSQMSKARNDYGEVCAYCHTPHGANTTLKAPLWNRTAKNNTYTLYSAPLTSGNKPTQPGVSSLMCLSCHDGTTAVDSVVNMPGSGGYSALQISTDNNAFLNTWSGSGPAKNGAGTHFTLQQCNSSCHDANGPLIGIPDFTSFVIGTDLSNDHPVGVKLPDPGQFDFKMPNGTRGNLQFYDTNGDGFANPNEVRFYNTGNGFEVECASCHDPHGATITIVRSGPLNPSFLRINNDGSALCLTCHVK